MLLTNIDRTAEHMQDIVGLLFKYIHLVQQSGICKWIFDEVYTHKILLHSVYMISPHRTESI
jgi:secreted Zn-dependent insulinase-like peptidase